MNNYPRTDLRPCVFFDRDGVANESPGPGYVERPEDLHVLPGFLAALRVAREKGYAAVIVTNQRGVARGLVAPPALEAMHQKLRSAVRQEGLELLDILVCPHERDACDCRKPKPGLLLQAAHRHGVDLARSWMVGDSETDVDAGRAAGCRTIRICPPEKATRAEQRVDGMDHLPGLLRRVL